MTKVLARCVDCGRVLTGEKGETTIRPIGTSACPDCNGTELREVTNDSIDPAAG